MVLLVIVRNNEERNTMNPVINVGTEKNPMMVLCATTMVMMYEEATGKTFGDDTMDDYVKYCDDYCDGYNKGIE
jgi:hypothetical protein